MGPFLGGRDWIQVFGFMGSGLKAKDLMFEVQFDWGLGLGLCSGLSDCHDGVGRWKLGATLVFPIVQATMFLTISHIWWSCA